MDSIYLNNLCEKNLFMDEIEREQKNYSSYSYLEEFEPEHCFAYISVYQNPIILVYGYGIVMKYIDGIELFQNKSDMREMNMYGDLHEWLLAVCRAIVQAVRRNMKKITVIYFNFQFESFLLGNSSLAESDIMIARHYVEFLNYYRKEIRIDFKRACTPEEGMMVTWADQIAAGVYTAPRYCK